MFEIIEDIVREVTGIQSLTLDTDFIRDLALDSFDIVNLISLFEQRFGIEIPVREIWGLNTVNDVLVYLQRKGVTA